MLHGIGRASRCAAHFIFRIEPLMANTAAPQLLDFVYRPNAAASSESRAVQCCRGATIFKYHWKYIPAQQGVSESGMKDVARSGGVHRVHAEGRAVVELRSVPRQDAVASERRASHAAAEAARDLRQRLQ